MRLMMYMKALALGVLAVGLSVPPGFALSPQEAAALPDRVLGKADAPVSVIEYASLTCGHCAHFHEEVLPKLKEKYIETGKVKFIFRDFPIDGAALRAAAITRCMPEGSYHAYVGILFKNMHVWAHADDPVQAAAQYARLGGLSLADAEACANDTKLLDAISDVRLKAEQTYKISATPSFVLNEGKEVISGGLPYERFAAKLDALLAAVPPATAPAVPTPAPVAAPTQK